METVNETTNTEQTVNPAPPSAPPLEAEEKPQISERWEFNLYPALWLYSTALSYYQEQVEAQEEGSMEVPRQAIAAVEDLIRRLKCAIEQLQSGRRVQQISWQHSLKTYDPRQRLELFLDYWFRRDRVHKALKEERRTPYAVQQFETPLMVEQQFLWERLVEAAEQLEGTQYESWSHCVVLKDQMEQHLATAETEAELSSLYNTLRWILPPKDRDVMDRYFSRAINRLRAKPCVRHREWR